MIDAILRLFRNPRVQASRDGRYDARHNFYRPPSDASMKAAYDVGFTDDREDLDRV
jgi:hypothetical protein